MTSVADPWDRIGLALTLLAVDPTGLGGLVLRARASPARDLVMSALPDLGLPVRRIHPAITDQELYGGIDVASTLATGKLVQSAGVLCTPATWHLSMAERCPSDLAPRLAGALDRGDGAMIVIDEGAEPEEAAPAALLDRLAFHVDLHGVRAGRVPPPSAAAVAAARAKLRDVYIAQEAMADLTRSCAVLGIDSLRAPLLALRAARCHAALAGRGCVAAADLEVAASLVLAHRATALPEAAQPPEAPDQQAQPHDGDPGEGTEFDQDRMVDAVRVALPDGLLPQALAQRTGAAGAGAGDKRQSRSRGRPTTPRRRVPDGRSRIDLIATLRNAAPWQRLRAQPGRKLTVVPSDICLKRYELQAERLLIFVVDASGSAAFARLNEAKGAVEHLLARAYAHRDRVALIGFRGTSAELLLPPNRSLVQAKRRLAALPGGGATPLASGLQSAGVLARRAQAQGMSPTLILLTDGRANIALNGEADRARAHQDAETTADWLRSTQVSGIVLDTAVRPQNRLIKLADRMGAQHLPLPRADSAGLSQAIEATVRA